MSLSKRDPKVQMNFANIEKFNTRNFQYAFLYGIVYEQQYKVWFNMLPVHLESCQNTGRYHRRKLLLSTKKAGGCD